MKDWRKILEIIRPGTEEEKLKILFVQPLLQELGFTVSKYTKNQQFTGQFQGSRETVEPDYTCWASEAKSSMPVLVVEDKAVQPELMNLAIEQVQKQMIITSASFGLATNGLQLQLFQRHGKICVPRTPIYDVSVEEIEVILKDIRSKINKPRRALTVMFWNHKGGVGKTTITANIGAALATNQHTKVLIINFDLQGDINPMFDIPDMTEYQTPVTMWDALEDVATGVDEIQPRKLVKTKKFDIGQRSYKSTLYSIDIIPGDRSMFEVETEYFNNREISLRLLLEKSFYWEYDYILIDASPSWPVAKLAAYAADAIIPVVDSSNFAVFAVDRLKNIYLSPEPLGKWSLNNSPVIPKIIGYVINPRLQNPSADNAVKRIQEQLSKIGLAPSNWLVPNYAEIEKEIAKRKPVVYSSPNSNSASIFTSLVEKIF